MKYKIIDEDAPFRFKKVKKSEDYSEWHTQICNAAGIVDGRYPVSGFRVWMPWGHKMMELIHRRFQDQIEVYGAQRMFYPLIIPYEFAKRNESWWAKFETEGFHACTKSKGRKGFEGVGLIRPTGEPAMYPMFSMWVRSWKDLPVKSFQVCQNYRNESVTRPLMRPREFWWNEYHCAFASRAEVEAETELHLKLVKDLAEWIGVPVITCKKPDWEVFPGGIMSYENYIVMPDGKSIDGSSINNLGQSYSKKFGVKFTDEAGKNDFAWVVCTGFGPRWIAGLLSFYGDDKGLVLTPNIAPLQLIIVPIIKKSSKGELKFARKVLKKLERLGLRVDVDDRDVSVGRKFYDWEIKGVPLRLEIGSKEVAGGLVTVVERDSGKKSKLKFKDLGKVKVLLEGFQFRVYKGAQQKLKSMIVMVDKLGEVMKVVNGGKVAKMYWCESRECYDKVMALGEGEGLDAFGTDPKLAREGECIVCKKKTKTLLFAANTY